MLKLAFAVLAGAALGVGATQMLHAQAKPPAFLVSDTTVTDAAKFKAWGERINPTIAEARREVSGPRRSDDAGHR